jgi:hypothetical protein
MRIKRLFLLHSKILKLMFLTPCFIFLLKIKIWSTDFCFFLFLSFESQLRSSSCKLELLSSPLSAEGFNIFKFKANLCIPDLRFLLSCWISIQSKFHLLPELLFCSSSKASSFMEIPWRLNFDAYPFIAILIGIVVFPLSLKRRRPNRREFILKRIKFAVMNQSIRQSIRSPSFWPPGWHLAFWSI